MLNDASVASAGSYIRTCRRIRNSKKIATIRDFHQNICVNSTKGALDKFNIIPQLFPQKVEIFMPLEVLAWVMTACWVLHSRFIYFWRNTNISSIFYFSKSTSINTQYSSLWDTLKVMLFTKYLIKWKLVDRISWKFRYWINRKFSVELDIKRWMLYLSNAPLNIYQEKKDFVFRPLSASDSI